MEINKILTMQDLSCVGQCSLTVALPILSSFGYETCVLPTAILSNHTMFNEWSYLDLSLEINNIFNCWKNNNFKFDVFLLGYLGKKELIDIAIKCFEEFKSDNSKIIIDPVFADGGKLYPNFNLEYVEKVNELIKYGDILLPNITEACFLTHIKYKNNYDKAFAIEVASKLKEKVDATIVITGIEIDNKIYELIYSDEYNYEFLEHELLPFKKHGTGDIFSSVFTSYYLKDYSIKEASNKAAAFVRECLKCTPTDHYYGVDFEKILCKINKE